MTAYDIFSALGEISDDMLEESETPAKRSGLMHIPMVAAAACLAFFAFGLRYMFYDSGIEQPVTTNGLSAITTDTPPVFSDLISDTEEQTSETTVTTVPPQTSDENSSSVNSGTELSSETYSTVTTTAVSTENTKKTTSTTPNTEEKESSTETVTAGTSATETSVTEASVTQTEASIIISIETESTSGKNTSYSPNPGIGGHETSRSETAVTSFTESTFSEVTDDEEAITGDDEDNDEAYEETYIFLDHGGSRYTQVGEFFDRSELTFLCAGEIYDIIQPGDQRVSKSCEIYKINSLGEKYMLAVLIDDVYIGYRNFGYKPDSLAGYVEDTDYLNRTSFVSVKAEEKDGSGARKYTLPDLKKAIETLVYSNPTAAEIPYTDITGTDRYDICGKYGEISAFVYENGYILINTRMFFAGEEYTAAFGEYIKNNAESSEFISHTQSGDTVDDEDENEDIMED